MANLIRGPYDPIDMGSNAAAPNAERSLPHLTGPVGVERRYGLRRLDTRDGVPTSLIEARLKCLQPLFR